MEQLTQLEALSERVAPGRFPSYTQAHLLYTLILLSKERLGRQTLASELQLGEGIIRTILGRLRKAGLISVCSRGVELSESGHGFLASVNKVLVWSPFPDSELTVDKENYVVLIRGAASKTRFGVEQRDQALLHGASGATTFVYQTGIWSMPGVNKVLVPLVSESLNSLNPLDGDVAVIGSSGDKFTAALGALAAGISLV